MFNQAVNTLSQKFNALTESAKQKIQKGLLMVFLIILGLIGSFAYALEKAMPHVHIIYSAAKLVDGEARGEPWRGQKAVFASVVNRVADKRFPDTMHGVIYQPYPKNKNILQYNAMGDAHHEDLSTETGQTILWRTAWWYTQWQLGIFFAPSEARDAHSYCTPEACERQRGYFGTLQRTGQIGNHVFYGDCPCEQMVVAEIRKEAAPTKSMRPQARPAVGTAFAPKRSLRPQMRPNQSSSQTEQIEAAVAAALAID